MQQPGLVAAEDVYKTIRSQIEHEDNLLAQRLNWFITSQSFLFSAYAISVSGLAPAAIVRTTINAKQMQDLVSLVPVVAILSSILIFAAILAGVIAMRNLRIQFKRLTADAGESKLPPVQGALLTRLLGTLAPLILPMVFLTVWTLLLMRDH